MGLRLCDGVWGWQRCPLHMGKFPIVPRLPASRCDANQPDRVGGRQLDGPTTSQSRWRRTFGSLSPPASRRVCLPAAFRIVSRPRPWRVHEGRLVKSSSQDAPSRQQAAMHRDPSRCGFCGFVDFVGGGEGIPRLGSCVSRRVWGPGLHCLAPVTRPCCKLTGPTKIHPQSLSWPSLTTYSSPPS